MENENETDERYKRKKTIIELRRKIGKDTKRGEDDGKRRG